MPGWLTLAAAGFGLRDARVRPGLAGIGLGVCGYLLVISLSSLPLCDRYALFASPFLLVLAGLGLAGAAGLAGRLTPMPRWAASGLLGAAALASVAGTWVRFDFSNLESWQPRLDEAITGLCGRAGRSSLLLMPELPWILYHRLQVMDRFLEARCYGPGWAGIAEQVAARGPRGVCVFVDAHNSAVDPALHTWLNGRTPHGRRIVLRTEGGRTLFSLYRIPPAEPPPSHDPGDWRGTGPPVPFRCGVQLLGIRSRVVRGGVRLETLWSCAPPPKRDWSIVFNLVDARGTRLGAAWVRPGDGTYPTSQWKAGERVLALLPSVSVTLWDRVGRVELGLRDELGFQTDRRTDTGVRSIWLDKSAIPAAREGVGGRVPRPSVAIP